jgi:hypothetical protein
MSKTRNQKQARTTSAPQDRVSVDLNEQKQPTSELATMLDAALSHDEMPQALFNVVVDYFQAKIEATGLAAPIPEISERPVMEMVLAAERRRELFVEQQEAVRLKSPAAAEGDGKGRNSPAELAAHLAAVMAHPETPVTLHNTIADELNSMVGAVNFYTADMIERMLESFKKQESEDEGGRSDD